MSTKQGASIASLYAMPLVGISNHEIYLVIISLNIDIFGCSKVDVQFNCWVLNLANFMDNSN
jgi:hypothetical protein